MVSIRNVVSFCVFVILGLYPLLGSADERFSWEGTYESVIDGGGTHTISVSRLADGKYEAEVKWSGRGTSGAVLYCDVRISKNGRKMILLYKRYESVGSIPVTEFNFKKGAEYLSLTRVVLGKKDPRVIGGKNVIFEPSGESDEYFTKR